MPRPVGVEVPGRLTFKPEVTRDEILVALKTVGPMPMTMDAVWSYVVQSCPPDQARRLQEILAALPPVGIPSTPDPEIEGLLEEERREAMREEPEVGVLPFTYGLAPELEQLKNQVTQAKQQLKNWRSENLAKAKAMYAEGKEKLRSWRDQMVQQLKAAVPKTASPPYYQGQAQIYEQYYIGYGKLAVAYLEAKTAVQNGYLAAYYRLEAEYRKAYYLTKAALTMAGR